MPIIDIQRRMMELGRIRLGGEKGDNKPGKKLEHFRLTSASRELLDSAARVYGGEVKPWPGAPDEGYWQLYTETSEMEIILPPVFSAQDGSPTAPYSQWYELWSAGGCQRRCDGVTESISAKPCLCNPDDRECSMTTRINVMLPEISGIGTWLIESHGYYAAAETTGTLAVLQRVAVGEEFIRAVLRLEQRHVKRPNEPPRRFVVPVIDLPDTRVADLMPGTARVSLPPAERPQLPAEPVIPEGDDASFTNDHQELPPDIDFDDAALEVATNEVDKLSDSKLTARLSQRLLQLGQGDQASMITDLKSNQTKEEHHEWLVRQVKRAEKKLAERVSS